METFKATITCPSREIAKEFATAWSRYSLCGHTVSAKQADGTAYVILYGITEDKKEWIEKKVSAIRESL